MEERIVLKHENRRVPRYTSYPTAPHFIPDMTEERYRAWLAEIPPEVPLSLYLHVPFCRSMCWYCGCHTRATRQYAPVARYLEALRREIATVAAALPGRPAVGHIHWGGGTPSILEPDDFASVMTLLRDRFAVLPEAEVAVEIDPRVVTPGTVAVWRDTGVNRASLGVQSFEPAVQQAINRHQTFDQTAGIVAALRAAGITRLNLDLLYGLPQQTVAGCAETVARAVELAPDRLSVFGYAHLPEFKRHQRLIDAATLPGARERLAQMRTIGDGLVEAGYVPVGLDHFAKPDDELALALRDGTLRRNFQGYTSDRCTVLLGFGASAIGDLPAGYVQNAVPLAVYEERLAAGRLAVARGRRVTPADRVRRAIIERLMCDLRVDVDAVAARYGVDPAAFDEDLAALDEMARDGIARVEGRTVTVAEEYRLLVRSVAAAFDAYLRPEQGRHALAI